MISKWCAFNLPNTGVPHLQSDDIFRGYISNDPDVSKWHFKISVQGKIVGQFGEGIIGDAFGQIFKGNSPILRLPNVGTS